MAQYIYTMNGVGKVVPPQTEILKNISLNFFPGAKIGVLGYNGAGKSTLLRIMAGVDTDYVGEARPQTGIKIGYLAQEPELDDSLDVRGNVELGVAETKALLDQFNQVNMKFAEPMSDDEMNDLLAQQAELQEKIEAAGAWDLDRKLDVAADALRLPPWEAAVEHLSGGEKRRVALCRLLLSNPDMLILDEPTNHLDAESVAWLERFLQDFPGTVVAVTHDRYFLDNVAGWILELDRGHGIPWEGNYSSWLEQKEKRLEHEERSEKARIKSMKAELEWVHANPKGRQSKSKARLKRFEELSSQDYQKSNCRAAVSSALSGPTAPARPHCFGSWSGRKRSTRVRLKSEIPSRSPMSTSRVTISTAARRYGKNCPTGWTTLSSAATKCPRALTCRASISAGRPSRSSSRTCRAANATACTWPSC
jgi:ATPase subunit of ABC transporter with duplicated ATPase domains